MTQRIQKTENKVVNWTSTLRVRVGDVVTYNSVEWVNLTGKNGEPGSSNDWLLTDESSSRSLTIANEITTNTTFSGTEKGVNSIYPVGNTSDLQITIDKGTYSVGDIINIKRNDFGGVEIVRGTDIRLDGDRDINNEFHITNKGGYAAIIFDRLDGSTLVGSVIGDINSGYSGAVTTVSYTELKEGDTAKDITVIGSGFSENMIVTSSANATLNSWVFVNNNQITLNLTAVGVETNTVTITYDNGDLFVDTDAITIAAAAPSIVLFEDDFTGTSLDALKWNLDNPDSADLTISQNNKLLFTRTTDNVVASSLTNNITTDNSYAKGGALSALLNADTGYSFSNPVLRWIFSGTTDFLRVDGDNGVFTLVVKAANVSVYSFTTAISSSNRVKITYESSNDIKFWYWSGVAWAQMGTTQNFNLGASGTVSISSNSNSGDAVNDVFSFDEVRVTNADYTTQLPV